MNFKKLSPFLTILALIIIFFYKFFLQGLLPIPSDIITGVYYPWLDYKWGNEVGVAVKNPLMSDIPSLIYPWRTLAIGIMSGEFKAKLFVESLALIDRLPLWNQYSFSGYPLLGNWQSAPFSPANLFYIILPLLKGRLGGIEIGWSLGIIFQPLLAMYFMYLWLRNKKLNQLPSILGGFLYAFSGFHLTWMYYNTHQWVTLWLPLILLSIDKILENNKALNHKNIKTNFPSIWYLKFDIWNLILAASISASILSGYPIILVYEAIIIVIYLTWKLVNQIWIRHSKTNKDLTKNLLNLRILRQLWIFPQGDRQKLLNITTNLIISISLGLGISAIQWLPGLETIQQSIHHLDTSTLQSANQGYLPNQNLITALAPDFFGNPATYNYWGIGYYDNWAFYISIGGLTLATFAFINQLWKRHSETTSKVAEESPTYFTLIISLLGILLATNNPLGNFITNLIPLLKNSIHSRALFLFNFGIAIAAAHGLQTLVDQQRAKLNQSPITYTLLLFTFLFALVWTNLLTSNYLNIPNLTQNISVAKRNLILPTGIFILTSMLILATTFRKRHFKTNNDFPKNLRPKGILRQLWMLSQDDKIRKLLTLTPYYLLLTLIFLDLFRYFHKYLPFTPSQYLYPPTEITNWLTEQKNKNTEPFRVEFGEVIPENMWIPYRLESPTGYDALMPLRYGQFLQAIQSGKLENTISRFPKIENLDSRLFELTNTKYVLALKYTDKLERSAEGEYLKDLYNKNYLQPVYEHDTVVVLENLRYLPRAFLVPDAEIISDDSKLITILTDPSTDFLQTVYLNTTAHYPSFEGGARGDHLNNSTNSLKNEKINQFPNYSISWHQTTGNQRQLTVTTNQPGYLVLLESYHPGWQAKICQNSKSNVTCHMSNVYRANFTYMTIPINKGENQITLTYFPDSFKYGLWGTGISLVIWFLIFLKAKLS